MATAASQSDPDGNGLVGSDAGENGPEAAPQHQNGAANVWWVNQGKTFGQGEPSLWAPLQDKGGHPQPSWTRLTEMKSGDLVVHCSAGAVRALSRVASEAVQATLPTAHPEADGQRQGWHVTLGPLEPVPPLPIKPVADAILGLNLRDGPLNRRGNPKEGYVWRFKLAGLKVLKESSSHPWAEWVENLLVQESNGKHSPRIVKIAPGHGAEFWEECLSGWYICVGWDEVGDLAQFPTKEDFKKKFRTVYAGGYNEHEPTISKKVNEVWTLRELRPGDLVVANRGTSEVLGVGKVLDEGYRWREDRSKYKNTVSVRWDVSFAKKIPAQPLWVGTTVAEVPSDLARLIIGSWPPLELPYDRLLASLKGRGLHFSEELISNYLLALQSKRFVILTGISGTGKTQLAVAVARHFQPTVRVVKPAQPPVGAIERTVRPYMLKFHRITLPADIRARLRLPPPDPSGNSPTVEAIYPEGKTGLTVYRDASGAYLELLFKHPFHAWFDAHLKVGDHFFLDIEPSEDESPDQLRFTLVPETAITEPLSNCCVVAVRPDWTDNRGLLGYYNPLTREYCDTPFLRFLQRAGKECDQARIEGRSPYPFFVVLDEMNLARVEHYFSDFLSGLESGELLHLHDDPAVESGEIGTESAAENTVPQDLPIPENLFITGTVNVDETTYMFSPKVLDRAFTLEINQVDLAGYCQDGRPDQQSTSSVLRLDGLPATLQVKSKPSAEDWEAFGELLAGQLRQMVVDLHQLLAVEHRHFGYRVANEIARFVTLAAEQSGSGPEVLWAAQDLAVLQKVLPKFHGTQQELEPVLKSLFAFSVAGKPVETSGGDGLDWKQWLARGDGIKRVTLVEGDPFVGPKMPRTATKLWRMLRRLQRQGFTSFVE